MASDLLLFGSGEYARSLLDELRVVQSSYPVDISLVVLDSDSLSISPDSINLQVLSEADIFLARHRLVNPEFMIAFASSDSVIPRHNLFLRVIDTLGYTPRSHYSEGAIIADSANIEGGCYIGRGCMVNSFSSIGSNSVIFSGSIVEHDCRIGSGVVIGPGAVICGGAIIGDQCFIGAGTCVVDHAVIDNHSFVKANSLVSRNDKSSIQPIRCR